MTKLTFFKLYFRKQWQFISRNRNFYEWKYNNHILLYDASNRLEGFYVKPPGFSMIHDRCDVNCIFPWRSRIFRFFMLSKIRKMARIELLKEVPKLRKHQQFISHLEKTYPKTVKLFDEWFRMQSGIYRGYRTGTAIHEDFFSLAGVTYKGNDNWQNDSIEKAYMEAENKGTVVRPRIREEDIEFSKISPEQYSKEALATIGLSK